MNFEITSSHFKFRAHQNGLSLKGQLPVETDIVGIFGSSGSGKSTLLKAVAGIHSASFETLNIDYNQQLWQDVNAVDRPFVIVSDKTHLFPHLDVKQNLDFVVKHGKKTSNIPYTLDDVIHWCGIKHLLQRAINALSSGEKQRIIFARALMSGKPVMLLDEAFSAIDWHSRDQFASLLRKLKRDYKMQFVMVSHSLKELAMCCDHIVWIEQGEVVSQGPSKKLVTQISSTNNQPTLSQLSVKFDARLAQYQLTRWQVEGTEKLLLFSHISDSDDELEYLVIDGSKVVINKESSQSSSMVNQLPATIQSVEQKQNYVLITLTVNGQTILAEISAMSQERMALDAGQTVYAQFKVV
ncbi:ATP-binding cassette domain-containing protein [Psychrosphaera sp. 1_MG-2023]|uniref:ATP-binding cassette domain-containing protein n=1 Tax=Psychrosphaera sp. 1_MG-2023 TaxID=3062643 RepID=UPI0026E1D440|nr:ATP-binding cassette domain-containing protein [Psychrosphaera sp. 1_MG-2023]MDO6719885.1 ATP-binding cassette domain-containing protein [Psychrosphaera sp. 1_MG-2023]